MSARRIAQLTAWLLALALCACSAPKHEEVPRPGRIILISMDTVRADFLTGYSTEGTTPALFQIANEGVRMERFYAASNYTIPSHMTMFTGLDPFEHSVTFEPARLNPEVTTLAERLRAAGYHTQAFHEGVYVAGRFGFDQGFDQYEEVPRLGVPGEALPRILAWMRLRGDAPYFLFLHTYAAHYPYGGYQRYRREQPDRRLPNEIEIDALRDRYPVDGWHGTAPDDVPDDLRLTCTLYNQLSEGYEKQLTCGDNLLPADFPASPHGREDLAAIQRSYRARIRSIDRAIGRIRARLQELGQWHDTLLIVTADHGEAFYEHGLYRHRYVPFEEVLHVPLIISYPQRLASRLVKGVTWQLDLLPTVLSLAGLDPVPGTSGLDLSPVLLGQAEVPADRAVFPVVLRAAHLPQEPPRRVTVRGNLKRIEGHPDFGDEAGFLFDLSADPGEHTNLRSERPGDVAELDAATRAYVAGLHPHAPVHQVTGKILTPRAVPQTDGLPEAEKAKLRALGYVN